MASSLRERFTRLDPPFGQVDIEKPPVEGEFLFTQPTSQGVFPQRHRKALSAVPRSLLVGRMRLGPQRCTVEDSPGSTAPRCSDAFCARQLSFTEPEHKAAPNKNHHYFLPHSQKSGFYPSSSLSPKDHFKFSLPNKNPSASKETEDKKFKTQLDNEL